MKLIPSRRVIYSLDHESKYMTRFTFFEIGGWSLKLHRFHRGDEDRDLHDHPWSFWSLILRGGYWEVTQTPCPFTVNTKMRGLHVFERNVYGEQCWYCSKPKSDVTRKWYPRWSFLRRPAPWSHRVDLEPGTEGKVWTLVLTAPKSREWGFSTLCGWVPWFKYFDRKTEGC